MYDARPQVPAPGPRAPRAAGWFKGAWYFAITVVSFGFLAAIPFWHAASRLGRRDLRTLALTYTLAGIYLVVIFSVTPRNADGTTANETLSVIGGLSAFFILIVGCLHLRPLRRQVYGGGRVVLAHDDPVVARALEARSRRQETRRLLAREPALRRELGIGRPDLNRGYDDGGLIDLNTAPARVIATVCGIELPHAEAIVAGRRTRGGTYFNIGEVLVDVPLPPHVQDELRERAVF
ncbi:hypothetical protein [Blastococcus sp. TF02A-30]|uniref:hypothetical protein n=1 Tax=Blastococcus sp. TF02A-30 TaxID=2250580 RepID=UPI000DE89784|nr:hypothetical protein [Blastococcus sp. TF02A-30]RBY91066.1 hypothetical protein DQ241_05170 [Blastococcus sp. TF02A-30]